MCRRIRCLVVPFASSQSAWRRGPCWPRHAPAAPREGPGRCQLQIHATTTPTAAAATTNTALYVRVGDCIVSHAGPTWELLPVRGGASRSLDPPRQSRCRGSSSPLSGSLDRVWPTQARGGCDAVSASSPRGVHAVAVCLISHLVFSGIAFVKSPTSQTSWARGTAQASASLRPWTMSCNKHHAGANPLAGARQDAVCKSRPDRPDTPASCSGRTGHGSSIVAKSARAHTLGHALPASLAEIWQLSSGARLKIRP
jgi:hypothetical protein